MRLNLFPGLGLLSLAFFVSCSHHAPPAGNEKEGSSAVQPSAAAVVPAVLWTSLPEDSFPGHDTLRSWLKHYRVYRLNTSMMRTQLSGATDHPPAKAEFSNSIIELPRPDSGMSHFAFYRTATMDPALAAKYPELQTYGGRSAEDATASLSMEMNAKGFHAWVSSAHAEWFIQTAPKAKDTGLLLVFFKKDMLNNAGGTFEDPWKGGR